MSIQTFVLSALGIVAAVYVLCMLVRERGDFEASAEAGGYKFLIRAKQKK